MPQGKENLVGEGTDSDEAALLRKLNGRLLGEIATYKRQLGAMERQGVSPEQC